MYAPISNHQNITSNKVKQIYNPKVLKETKEHFNYLFISSKLITLQYSKKLKRLWA